MNALLKIDRTDLDGEVERHPQLLADIGVKVAYAINNRDLLREERKRGLAATAEALRDDYPKATVARMNDLVEEQSHVLKLRNKYRAACLKVDELQAIYDAFRARGFALRDLCQMELSGMYSRTFMGVGNANSQQMVDAVTENRRARMTAERQKREVRAGSGTASTETRTRERIA